MAMQIIVACVDPDMRDFIAHVLNRSGFSVQHIADFESLSMDWLENPADLVILAGMDQHELNPVVKALRRTAQVALMVLIERSGESEIHTLLQSGADLVLGMPIGPKVLASYCHTLLRRSKSIPAFALPALHLGPIALDPSTRSVSLQDRAATRLTQLEFRLLYTLMTHRGQVIPWEVIVNRVWGYSGGGSRELVRGLVSRLRSKVEPDPSSPNFVHTISGVGYKFDIESQ
jgi:DNA-binding response OmpR family regulator